MGRVRQREHRRRKRRRHCQRSMITCIWDRYDIKFEKLQETGRGRSIACGILREVLEEDQQVRFDRECPR